MPEQPDPDKTASKLPRVLELVAALILGGYELYRTWTEEDEEEQEEDE